MILRALTFIPDLSSGHTPNLPFSFLLSFIKICDTDAEMKRTAVFTHRADPDVNSSCAGNHPEKVT